MLTQVGPANSVLTLQHAGQWLAESLTAVQPTLGSQGPDGVEREGKGKGKGEGKGKAKGKGDRQWHVLYCYNWIIFTWDYVLD